MLTQTHDAMASLGHNELKELVLVLRQDILDKLGHACPLSPGHQQPWYWLCNVDIVVNFTLSWLSVK